MLVHPAFIGLLLAALVQAAETPNPALLALSKSDHTLAIIDPTTLKTIARMPSGPDPHEVIASSNGKFAYISNYGFGAYNTITVVDLVRHKTLNTIDLGPLRGPHGLDFVGGKLWFTAEAAKVIGSYDSATQKVDWVMGTGQDRTHMLLVTPDLKRIITSNVSSATMTILEQTDGTRRGPGGPPPGGPGNPPPGGHPPGAGPGGQQRPDWLETIVPVGNGAEGFDLSPDGREVWAANAQDGTISILDFAAKKVIETLAASVAGANRLKFTPDGAFVFVSTLRGPEVIVFDSKTRKEVKRIPAGHGAAGILMQPDGLRAFVASTPDDTVFVIDLKSMMVINQIDAGKQPDGLAWAVRNP